MVAFESELKHPIFYPYYFFVDSCLLSHPQAMEDQDFPGFRHFFVFWGFLLVIQQSFLTPLPLFIDPKVYIPAAPDQNDCPIQEPVSGDHTPLIQVSEECGWLVPYTAVLLPIVLCSIVHSGLVYLIRIITNHNNETPKFLRTAKSILDIALRLVKNNPIVGAILILGRFLLQLDRSSTSGEYQRAKTNIAHIWDAACSVFPVAVATLYLMTLPIVDVSRWTGIPNPYLTCSVVLIFADVVLLRAYLAARGSQTHEACSGAYWGGSIVGGMPILSEVDNISQRRYQRQQRLSSQDTSNQHVSDSDYEGDRESDNSQSSIETKVHTDSSLPIAARFDPLRTRQLAENRNSTPATERGRHLPAILFEGSPIRTGFPFSPSAASTPIRSAEAGPVVESVVLAPLPEDLRPPKASLAMTPAIRPVEADTAQLTLRCSVPHRQNGRLLCSLPARPAQVLVSPRLADDRQVLRIHPKPMPQPGFSQLLTETEVLWSTIPPPPPAVRDVTAHVRRRLI